MPKLLCSLGSSAYVVMEAYLYSDYKFNEVHVITSVSETTDNPIQEVKKWFSKNAPEIQLTIDRVDGFSDLKTNQDHELFEETLFRWILEKAPDPEQRIICLAGGFKTMSSSMQQAAVMLGAQEVFHVLAPIDVKSPEKLLEARDHNLIHPISLGSERGWPQLLHLRAQEYPLKRVIDKIAPASPASLRQRLFHTLSAHRNLTENFSIISKLPFPILATCSPAQLDSLREPIECSSHVDQAWLRDLPKVELHCHLGGFATHGEDLEKVRKSAIYSEKLPELQEIIYPEEWPYPAQPITLDDYMKLGDNNGSKILRDPGCLIKQCELLYQRLIEDKVLYAEIRCSPNNYASDSRSAWKVLDDIRNTFQQCMEKSKKETSDYCHINLIIIASRKNVGDRSDISRHLSLAVTAADHWKEPHTCRVVGVDLAGFENKETRASLFMTDFEPVHRVGLAVTIHAGENDDAEGVWQAVFKLNARRLGHALHLKDSPDLMRVVAERGIAVEMCPLANLQIKGYHIKDYQAVGDYPALDYLNNQGIAVTLNTDNMGISAGNLTDNLIAVGKLCPNLNKIDILGMLSHSIDHAFLYSHERQHLLERFISQLKI